MADKKISELNSAAAVYDADDFALVQDGDTKQVNASAVKAYVKDGLSKSDVGLGNVDNTSDANKNSATATLTNKTISGSSNTLSNIGNSSLTNSSITINGNAVSLGGSTTVSAATTNTLTIGTGLSGTSFNGSSAVTIAIDSSVVTLTDAQTLTNKTLTGPVISGGTANNVAIGGTTPAAGSFTTLSSTGNTTLGDAAGDTLTINGTAVSAPNGLRVENGTSATNVLIGNGASAVPSILAINGGSTGSNGPVIFGQASASNEWLICSLRGIAGAGAGLGGLVDYVYGAYPRVFYTNAAERMRIDSSGNVGIGTSSPNTYGKFVVSDAQNAGAFCVSSSTTGYSFLQLTNTGASGRSWQFVTGGSSSIYTGNLGIFDATAGTVRLTIDASGNVGIGTSSPAHRLDVSGTIRSSVASNNYAFFVDNGTYSGGLIPSSAAGGLILYNAVAQPLGFWTNNAQRMSIGANGSCTWTPNGTAKMVLGSGGGLTVVDNVYVPNNFGNAYSSAFTATATGGANSQLAGYQFRATFGGSVPDTTPRRSADIWSGYNGSSWGTEFLAFGVGGATDAGNATQERMRLDASGRLGIGATLVSYPLHVLNTANQLAGFINSASNTNAWIGIGTATGGVNLGVDTDNVSYLYTTNSVKIISGGVERIRVKGTGQVRFVPLASDPAGAENGDMYYNSTSNTFRVYQAGAWKTVTTA